MENKRKLKRPKIRKINDSKIFSPTESITAKIFKGDRIFPQEHPPKNPQILHC